jgi:hypothetical protein
MYGLHPLYNVKLSKELLECLKSISNSNSYFSYLKYIFFYFSYKFFNTSFNRKLREMEMEREREKWQKRNKKILKGVIVNFYIVANWIKMLYFEGFGFGWGIKWLIIVIFNYYESYKGSAGDVLIRSWVYTH